MNSSHFHTQSWAPVSAAAHSSFSDIHQHLDDHSPLFEDWSLGMQSAMEAKPPFLPQAKAKVLFQFFDGWPMSDS